MSTSEVIQVGPHWHGFLKTNQLVIFGDSYSDVASITTKALKPTTTHPLGVEFPGTVWSEPDLPNWVGHLITKYCPHPRFDPEASQQSEEYYKNPLLVHDYAVGGDTVSGVRHQIQVRFLPHAGTKPDWAPWNADNSLFVLWVGINDCARTTDPFPPIKALFQLSEELYNAGARNFMFIDVPPIFRAPGASHYESATERSKRTIGTWNEILRNSAGEFSTAHKDATTLLFSSDATFHKLLDNAALYGFDPLQVTEYGGPFWLDWIHPRSRVHDYVAQDVAEFLNSVLPLADG